MQVPLGRGATAEPQRVVGLWGEEVVRGRASQVTGKSRSPGCGVCARGREGCDAGRLRGQLEPGMGALGVMRSFEVLGAGEHDEIFTKLY